MTALEKRLYEALCDLYDEQNGPPLLRREAQWQNAMDSAEDAISSYRAKMLTSYGHLRRD